MPLTLDPQIGAALQALVTGGGEVKRPPVGDWKTRRENGERMFAAWGRLQPKVTDVTTRDFTVRGRDGHELRLRWFQKAGPQPGSAAVYVHGGGMILGTLDGYDAILRPLVSQSGVPLLAVDYRRAPEHPYPAPVEDVCAALVWLADHALELSLDGSRLAVMGDSAGGGLAAGAVLLARDRRGPLVAKQILVYPMLDDRNLAPIPELAPFATWTWDDNRTGWGALLGEMAGQGGVPPYAAPARATDLSNLPRTYLEVGQLDIFCDEGVAYAQRLLQARVPTELHVRPGLVHGFELFAPEADASRSAIADRVRALRSI